MHIGKNATDASNNNEGKHNSIKDGEDKIGFDISGEDEGGESKNGGNDHDVSRREGRLTGAVRAGIQNEELIKDKVSGGHKSKGEWHPEELFIYLFKRLAFNPLAETKNDKNGEDGKGGNEDNVGD